MISRFGPRAGASCAVLAALAVACGDAGESSVAAPSPVVGAPGPRLDKYRAVALAADAPPVGPEAGRLLEPLGEAAAALDDLFWRQVLPGGKKPFLAGLGDPALRRFAEINYGPWDRVAGSRPFVGNLPKPAGAAFYPTNLGPEELAAAMGTSATRAAELASPFTVVRRDEQGALTTVAYHVAFAGDLENAAGALFRAAERSPHAGLSRYLELQARALLDDDHGAAADAWLGATDGPLWIWAGPLSRNEDALRGTKYAFGLVAATPIPGLAERLERDRSRLEEMLQAITSSFEGAAVRTSGTTLAGGDLLLCSGACSAGPKRVAFVLPPEGLVSGRPGVLLVLPNVIRAKYRAVVAPIAAALFAPGQRDAASEQAFVDQTLWYESAHELWVEPAGAPAADRDWLVATVRSYTLALALAAWLAEREPGTVDLESHYVTYVASLVRGMRLGAETAHGPASLAQFTWLVRQGALTRGDGGLAVDVPRMKQAVRDLAATLLGHEARGQRTEAARMVNELRRPDAALVADVERLDAASVPVDVHFE